MPGPKPTSGVSSRTMARRAAPRYEPAGFFLIRAPLLPASGFHQLMAASGGSGGGASPTDPRPRDGGAHGLSQFLLDPRVKCAVIAASPALSREAAVQESASCLAGVDARVFRSLFRYLNRMSTRPTPYGLLAAVGAGHFAASTSLRLAADPLLGATFRPDMGWLECVVREAERLAGAHSDIRVLARSAVLERGQRMSQFRQSSTDQGDDASTVSIRSSGLVRDALELAREPIALDELARLMSQRHGSATLDQLRQLLWRLYELDFLASDLLPTGLTADPCSDAAERIPGGSRTAHMASQLRDIGHALHELERASHSGLKPADLLDVARKQHALAPGHEGPASHIDAALNLVGQELSWTVGQAVADAMTAVAAVTTGPDYSHLRAYAAEFTERYGAGAEIPVLEVLDPHWGLDAPPTYLFPPRLYPQRIHGGASPEWREDLLMSWIQEAALDNQPIVLSDERIAQLSRGTAARRPRRLVEAYVQLHAASREAVDRGDWLAVIGPMGIVPGARSFGRFSPLLGPASTELQEYVAQEQEFGAGAVHAELSYRPSEARMANVSGHLRLRNYEIPVNVAPTVEPGMVLPLTDLLAGVHEGEFYIKSRRLGREVIARQSHMLNSVPAPNVCHFLLEVSGQRDGAVPAFRDTLFDRLPFCPRVIREQVVLLPACWNLTPATLKPTAAGAEGSFADAVLGWRIRMRVPRHVYLSASDQRLLLDLDDATCLAQLEYAVGRLNPDPRHHRHYQKLQEVLPGFDGTWLGDEQGNSYFSEMIIPLALTAGTTPPRPAIPVSKHKVSASPRDDDRLVLPGGRWAYLKLHAAPDRHNKVIASFSRFAGELESKGVADSWFFIRYADPAPQLRVRVHSSTSDAQADVLLGAVQWARSQVEEHAVREFSVDTYKPEIERYGGARGVCIAEQIFHGDSRGVGAVISGITMGSVTCDPLVATAFTLDRLLTALRLEDGEKLRLACLRQSSFTSTAPYRGRQARLAALLRSVRGDRGDAEAELLDDLYGYGASRCAGLAAQAAALDEGQELLRPWPDVMNSIAHMHINRMLGTDRDGETEAYALLRGALRSVLSFTSSRVIRR